MRTEGCLGCWVCDMIDQKHCNVSTLHVYLEFLQKLLTESPSFDRNFRCGIIRINLRPGCHGWSWRFLLVVVGIQQYHLNCCVTEYFCNSCLHVVTTTVGSIFVFCKCVIADGYDSGSGWLAVFKGLGFRALAPTARHSISNHKKRVCLGLLTILWISLASWLVL